jgi:hypothetical protein
MIIVGCPACFDNTPDRRDAHPTKQLKSGVAELGYDKFIVRATKNNTSKNAELMQCPECQSTHINTNGHKKGK